MAIHMHWRVSMYTILLLCIDEHINRIALALVYVGHLPSGIWVFCFLIKFTIFLAVHARLFTLLHVHVHTISICRHTMPAKLESYLAAIILQIM